MGCELSTPIRVARHARACVWCALRALCDVSLPTTRAQAAAVIYHTGVPLYSPAIPTLLLQCVPPARRGAAMGLDSAVNTAARIAAPLALGALYQVSAHHMCIGLRADFSMGSRRVARSTVRRWPWRGGGVGSATGAQRACRQSIKVELRGPFDGRMVGRAPRSARRVVGLGALREARRRVVGRGVASCRRSRRAIGSVFSPFRRRASVSRPSLDRATRASTPSTAPCRWSGGYCSRL